MPINRQAMDIRKKGYDIGRQTVNNWALRTCQDYLVPLADHMSTESVPQYFLNESLALSREKPV